MIAVQPNTRDQAEAYALLFSLCAADLHVATLQQLEQKLADTADVPEAVRAIATRVLGRAQDQADHHGGDWRDRVADDPAYAVRKIEALSATVELLERGIHPPTDETRGLLDD